MNDSYIYIITALLPLAACMLIFQTNPYHALIIRGILGAVAALVYTVLGAADVALTEALVGTLLAISLYAVAVRSSLVLRLGVLKDEAIAAETLSDTTQPHPFRQLLDDIRTVFGKHYMQVELVPYVDQHELYQALLDKDVHAICACTESWEQEAVHANSALPYATTTRLHRIYEILQIELAFPETRLSYINPSNLKEVQG